MSGGEHKDQRHCWECGLIVPKRSPSTVFCCFSCAYLSIKRQETAEIIYDVYSGGKLWWPRGGCLG